MRFLVVDDDFQSRSILQRLLQPYGLTEVATDGEECVEAFRQSLRDDEPYDLITLDILMPTATGRRPCGKSARSRRKRRFRTTKPSRSS